MIHRFSGNPAPPAARVPAPETKGAEAYPPVEAVFRTFFVVLRRWRDQGKPELPGPERPAQRGPLPPEREDRP